MFVMSMSLFVNRVENLPLSKINSYLLFVECSTAHDRTYPKPEVHNLLPKLKNSIKSRLEDVNLNETYVKDEERLHTDCFWPLKNGVGEQKLIKLNTRLCV